MWLLRQESQSWILLCGGIDAATNQERSRAAQKVFDACAVRGLHLALVQLPDVWFGGTGGELVTCLRSVLMKPEHRAWLDVIWERLGEGCSELG